MPLKDLPPDARPREKLLARGPGALSDVELLAILLRTGIKGKGVLQMARELLELKKSSSDDNDGFDGIAGLLHATSDDLKRIKGLGPAKRAELVAVLELSRRALAQQLKERTIFATPDAVKHYLQLHLAARPHEVFAVLFLDVQNRLLALEELFRGTLTQTSVAQLRNSYKRTPELFQGCRVSFSLERHAQTAKSQWPTTACGGRPEGSCRVKINRMDEVGGRSQS